MVPAGTLKLAKGMTVLLGLGSSADVEIGSIASVTRTTSRPAPSHHASVGSEDLAVDPVPFRAGEEGNHSGDVLRRAQSLQRRGLGELVDLLGSLAVEEELGGRGPGRDGVHGDVPPAQLASEDQRDRL